MKDIVILIPTLGRPHHIGPLLRSIKRTTPNARPFFICTKFDDAAIEEIKKFDVEYVVIKRNERGDYAKKINVGYRLTDEPLIFTGATDLKFHPEWFENATAKLNDDIHVVGTNDLGNDSVLKGWHSTHSLVTREYVEKYGVIDHPGQVLCELYWHEFVDNEFVETAMARNAFAMAMDSVVEHMHPAFGKDKWDRSYRQVNRRFIPGQAVFEDRRPLWTQLSS